MNKTELIAAVADQTGLSRKDVEAALQTMTDTIIDTLADGEKVQMVGFGSFEVKNRATRIGRNPQTGEVVPIPPSRAVVFRPGKKLKDAIRPVPS